MKSLDILERNEKGKVKINLKNTMKIMYLIVVNEITNVYYYVKNDIGVDPCKFNVNLRIIENNFPDYYKYYKMNLDNNINIRNEKLSNILLYIGTLMNYGVELEDGTFRNFDKFDWYQIKNKYFDNLSRTEISKIIDSLSKDDIILEANINMYELRKMISKCYGNAPSKFEYTMCKEEVINDKNYGLSIDEAKKLVDFMNKNNIPVVHCNYDFGVEKMICQRENNNDLFNLNLHIPIKKRGNYKG